MGSAAAGGSLEPMSASRPSEGEGGGRARGVRARAESLPKELASSTAAIEGLSCLESSNRLLVVVLASGFSFFRRPGAAQMEQVPSVEQVTSEWPAFVSRPPKRTCRTHESWALKIAVSVGRSTRLTSQTRTVQSEEPDASRQPLCANSTNQTAMVWPRSRLWPVTSASPIPAFGEKNHSHTPPSWLPTATMPVSSGWVATLSTALPSPPANLPPSTLSSRSRLMNQAATEPSAPTDKAIDGSAFEKDRLWTLPS
mmetsp:Transcript_89267/g.161073  ORF Transcript_89267/g.161073 Transcript_89267/m.161073 type:complete len:255 (+) Transcript_89267:340-1104(+)